MATRDLLATVAIEPGYRVGGAMASGAKRSRAWVVAGPPRNSGGWAGRPCF